MSISCVSCGRNFFKLLLFVGSSLGVWQDGSWDVCDPLCSGCLPYVKNLFLFDCRLKIPSHLSLKMCFFIGLRLPVERQNQKADYDLLGRWNGKIKNTRYNLYKTNEHAQKVSAFSSFHLPQKTFLWALVSYSPSWCPGWKNLVKDGEWPVNAKIKKRNKKGLQ